MDQVSQVREKIDIVSLISEYIPLKKAGRNFKANCPFHGEKTPSFVVSPERQIWHCFGCGKGGDCFTFLMEYETLEFPEALRILAKRVGIEIQSTHFEAGLTTKKEKIYRLNRLALEFYHYLLTKHNVGKIALSYLIEKRKINEKIIDSFSLGFAPRIGNALVKFLIDKKKYNREDLNEAGLISFRQGGIFDFFAGRIMFPLFDHRDNVIGFSGRILEDPSVQISSKYINTRETLVYHKGDVFFGLNVAKDEIKKQERVIIMEGEFDVISSVQEGIKNTIAVKGTALTENQVQLISRFAQKVSLCFDQDKAGIDAVKRSLPVLEKKGLTVTVIQIPNGKDPDESIKENPVEFKNAMKNDIAIYDFLINESIKNFDKKSAEGKKKISDDVLPFISHIENEVVKEHYLKKLSTELDTSFESVVRQAEKIGKQTQKSTFRKEEKQKRDRREVLEEYLVALILQAKDVKDILGKTENELSEIEFKISAYKKIIDFLKTYFASHNIFDSKQFLRALPIELVPSFDECFLFPLSKFINEEKYELEINNIIKELIQIYLKDRIKAVSEKMKQIEKENKDSEELNALRIEFSNLVSIIK
ncbi:MAG: DNA primase [Patescibacteria group bacterium]|nr:DNA primase [Patescibacteria group bacterium]